MTYNLDFENTYNTRDLGEFYSADWSQIKNGLIFRSDRLSNLSENDLTKIKNLGITRIIDLRSRSEIDKNPNRLIVGIDYINYPIIPDEELSSNLSDILDGKLQIDDFFKKMYHDFVTLYSDKFGIVLKEIINNPKVTLYHCTSGKDRTGFLSLLIFLTLDVKLEIIIFDYLESNRVDKDINKIMSDMNQTLNISDEKLILFKSLFYVKREYILESINTIKDVYGSFDNYLNYLGITEEMKQNFKNFMFINRL